MKRSEKIAKHIVETLLPNTNMVFRESQSSGEHDFDIHFPDGQITPLEVTISTDASYLRLEAAIRNHQKGGPFVSTKLCSKDWYIFPNLVQV